MARRNLALLLSGAVLAVLAVSALAWRISKAPHAIGGHASFPVIAPRSIPTSTPVSETLVAVESARSIPPLPSSAQGEARGADESASESFADVADMLRRLLPERYGELSASEIAALTEVDLHGTEIGDEELARIAGLPNLRVLGLRGTAITDAGLACLSVLPLTALDLRATDVTALGLGFLPSGLEALHLTETQVDGRHLYRLPPLPHLERLKLNSLDIDDQAVEALCLYPSLSHVELDGTAISDVGLGRLLALNPRLTRVELRRTAVSKEALARFTGLHPACEFVVESDLHFR